MRLQFRLFIGLCVLTVAVLLYYTLTQHSKPVISYINDITKRGRPSILQPSKTTSTHTTTKPPVPMSKITTPITTRTTTLPPRPTNVPIQICGNMSDFTDVDSFAPSGRPKVDLFMNILTANFRVDRRMAIRNTWASTAKNYSIAYRFFTDSIGVEKGEIDKVLQENAVYKDIQMIPTKQGYWMSHRYLHALFWGYKHYDFKFYMRVDDDYFVCLNNLYNDLQYRMKEKLFYWGFLGCDPKMVAIDEGFIIVSIDLAKEFMKRNNSMCCHPMGGQMIGMWVNRLEYEGYDVTYFADNDRLMHYRSHLKTVDQNLCKGILGIHETYPEYMHQFWNVTKDSWFSIKTDGFKKVARKEYKDYCSQPKGWDWRVLNAFWKHEPKPCWQPGVHWPELDQYKSHKGRE
ncbi:hypothetical protein OS493_001166 [Desmophyllum pertusum]|uniref:Hexosyltransferase n=1 Tax=Desmophyllum pertusum TaxID=174260 RepID=A0A9W9ZUL3_9CNID|nr:hypothetical protein OS493_001166 [Desmophyllum pertusum]